MDKLLEEQKQLEKKLNEIKSEIDKNKVYVVMRTYKCERWDRSNFEIVKIYKSFETAKLCFLENVENIKTSYDIDDDNNETSYDTNCYYSWSDYDKIESIEIIVEYIE